MTEITAEQVRAMSAGSELDALVAKRVMGWHRENIASWYSSEGLFKHFINSWHPSIEYDGMKYVLLRMQSNGWYPSIELFGDDRWECRMYFPKHGEQSFAHAKTLPEAVAKAAVLAGLEPYHE